WSKVSSSTAGTIATNGTASLDEIVSMAVYNGSLYVGTRQSATAIAEVYRYDGGTTWTRVSQTTAGTIASGGTASIQSVRSMAVWNGSLYVGTEKSAAAEVYRYDGGTTWTKVSQTTAGTIASGGTASIDQAYEMAVYNGSLYMGTDKSNATEVYRYDGGTTWTKVSNATAGTITSGGTASINKVREMAVWNGSLYIGTGETNAAEVYRYDGGTTWTKVSSSTAGTIATGGTGSIDEISGMAVFMWELMRQTAPRSTATTMGRTGLRFRKPLPAPLPAAGLQALMLSPLEWLSTTAVFISGLARQTRLKSTAMTAALPGPRFLAPPPERLRLAEQEALTRSHMAVHNNKLYVGTFEVGGTEVYSFSAVEGQSYALKFGAASDDAGATEQSSLPNEGLISFLAEQQANNNAGNFGAGSFLFSHGITTAFGAYDVAEDYPTRDETLQPGELVAIDPYETGFVRRAGPGDSSYLVGVYSEKPALRLSQQDVSINGGRAIPVALAGRVTVKVKGDIELGDSLTVSDIPGVATKATKAGLVIGRALQSHSGDEIGTITVFVNIGFFNGKGVVSALPGLSDISQSPQLPPVDIGKQILLQLITGQALINPVNLSEIVTDRVVAGLEVITPRVITQNLATDTIKPATGQDLTISLNDEGKLVLKRISSASATSTDGSSTEA
ncbi:MAG: exo-alpha-sialidase, partial [Candidatus Vogelbacteria bacterium]|nr:exo-alpha-sialidase [Candidatus Vogelbacteria bacterium]